MAELSKIRKNGVDYDIKDTVARQGKYDYTKQGLPIIYLTGDTAGMDKDNAKDMSYVFGERSGTCSVKWQGSGAVDLGKALGAILGDESRGKYNYTIKFDTAFEAKEGWGEQKKYCLKANVADFSHARNLCATKLWGQACANRTSPSPKLYKCPNWGAVDGFPILVVINGEYYGLFTMNIPKDGWMLGMPTAGATREAIVCAEVGANFSGPVTMGNAATYEIEYVTDENDTGWVKESLDALMAAVASANLSEISARLDIDSAVDYLLMVARCTGGDALSRNYILHTYDGVKWAFTVYDADTWFGINWGGVGHVADDYLPTIADCAESNNLMNYLVSYAPEKITSRYKELKNSVLSASNITETVLDFSAQIPKAVFDAEVIRWPGISTTETNNANQIVDHIRAREKFIDEEITRLDAPQLKTMASWYDTTAAGAEMNTITDINFDPDYVVTGNEDASWNCSTDSVASIMAYRTGTVVTVKPIAHRYIRLSGNSSYMFANDGTNASFANLARITGTEIFAARARTNMSYVCAKCSKLTTPVYIPKGVTNINGAFTSCWQLRKPPVIPNGVMYMSSAFYDSRIETLPQIPATVLEMHSAFASCAYATNLPLVIPKGVKTMQYAFKNCYKASGFMRVEASGLTNYADAFLKAGRDTDGILIGGSCPVLAELAATNTDGKITVLE